MSPRLNKKLIRGNSPVIIIVIILIVAILVGFWFFSRKTNQISLGTPTPESTSSASPSTSGSPTPTPTGTRAATPTPRPATPTPTPVSQTLTLSSNGNLDGFEASNGGGNTTLEIRAGRNNTLIERGFVSFDIPSSLNGRTIETATLRLYQKTVIGTPYSDLGSLKVDHLDYGNSLENGDYSSSSLSASFGTLTGNSVIEWKDIDVKDMIKDDVSNSRQRSQYRIHFATETTGADDFVYFESADNNMGSGNTPQLVVKYH